MASSQEFVNYVCEQLHLAGEISSRKMFGEYGIYVNGKFCAMICDNQFFVKVTDGGRRIVPDAPLIPPYKGAKPCLLVESLENCEMLANLLQKTCEELPAPKPRTRKK